MSLRNQLNYLKKACFALLLIGAIFLVFSAFTSVSADKPVQWEYHVLLISNSSRSIQIQGRLNSLGQEGWEVVTVVPTEMANMSQVILKRRL